MKSYLRVLKNILENGEAKQPTRYDITGKAVEVENSTLVSFGECLRHNMADGYPLLTCRKMPFKSMCVELEGFIKGITSKSWFKERGCNYWNYWANPQEVQKHKYVQEFGYDEASPLEELEKEYRSRVKAAQEEVDDLGPIYGSAWRAFGQQYGKVKLDDWIEGGTDCLGEYQTIYSNINGIGFFGEEKGFDQLKYIVDTLKSNPYDRRMVCSAWNPNHNNVVALNPCHYAFNCVVVGNKLNLVYHMRSVDWILGSNIGMYGLLLTLLAKEANLECGTLMGTYADCHVYTNHVANATELLKREPLALPVIRFAKWNGIFNWEASDTILEGYESHPAMKFEVTV